MIKVYTIMAASISGVIAGLLVSITLHLQAIREVLEKMEKKQ